MKILLLFVSCLILLVHGIDEQLRDITDDTDIFDEQLGDIATSTGKLLTNKDCACGIPNPIVVSAERPLNRYPWALQLTTISANGTNQRFFGGAALINNRYAVSTASIFNTITTPVFARVVRTVGSQPTGYIRSVTVKVHPSYNKKSSMYNIALLKLSSDILLGNGIAPICLTGRNYVFQNRTGYTARWGHTTGGLISNSIRINKAPIISNADCKLIHPTNTLYPTQICAGPYVANNNSGCQSDNGGQLSVIDKTKQASGTAVNRHKLAGVASSGYGCIDSMRAPGVYMRVAPFINFIKLNTLDGVYCSA